MKVITDFHHGGSGTSEGRRSRRSDISGDYLSSTFENDCDAEVTDSCRVDTKNRLEQSPIIRFD
jgi:hypothetical protein